MKELAPSILSADFAKLGEEVNTVSMAGAKYLHIDVMDGYFVPNISLGAPIIKSIRKVSDMIFDVHLMISNPLKYIDDFAKAGADMISFHIESDSDTDKTIAAIKERGIKLGIVVKPNTDIQVVSDYLHIVDYILVMSVEPGFGGQSFMESSLDKVKWLDEQKKKHGYDFIIEIDGGISGDNVDRVSKAGVNLFVMGSAVFGKDNIYETTKMYVERLEELDK